MLITCLSHNSHMWVTHQLHVGHMYHICTDSTLSHDPRLLQAALMVIKSNLIGDTLERKLLFERFYATAFDYFW